MNTKQANTIAVQNPYALQAGAAQESAGGGALQAIASTRETTEVQSAIFIAKQFPRDPVAIADKIGNDCQRPSLAEHAVYSYTRGGSAVSGPSIRLAEALARHWGNLQYGHRELERRVGTSTVEAFAWDMETNTRRMLIFHINHIRNTKKGSYKLEDERDIYELMANQAARRVRACILSLIPADLVEYAVAQCEATLKAHADTSSEGIKKMLAAFEAYGIIRAQLEGRVACRLEAMHPAQMVGLKKIYASLRDGMSKPVDWFNMEPENEGKPAEKKTSLRDKVAAAAAKNVTPLELPNAPATAAEQAPAA